jgi:hypothetical protein
MRLRDVTQTHGILASDNPSKNSGNPVSALPDNEIKLSMAQ